MDVSEQTFDIFMCHASEDKAVARELAGVLKGLGVRVWLDEMVLRMGDSLRRSIDYGLANCRYGVVLLSPSFFRKEWPQRELDGLAAREANEKRKLILPVWHDLTEEEVRRYSPTLADKVALRTSLGMQAVAKAIFEIIADSSRVANSGPIVRGIERWVPVASDTGSDARRGPGITGGIVDKLMGFPNVRRVDLGPRTVMGRETNQLALRVMLAGSYLQRVLRCPSPVLSVVFQSML